MREAALTDAGATTAEKARQLCHRVYEMMAYEPETTTVETPAAEVFSRQCGVCQDYAHLMISFCRANGLPARYVNGFLEGTGQTHAWVEVFDGYSWQGYDPTHDPSPGDLPGPGTESASPVFPALSHQRSKTRLTALISEGSETCS